VPGCPAARVKGGQVQGGQVGQREQQPGQPGLGAGRGRPVSRPAVPTWRWPRARGRAADGRTPPRPGPARLRCG
jgi:hypothetical protein